MKLIADEISLMVIFIDTEKLLMELDHKSSVDCMDNCYEIYDAVSRN